MHIDFDPNKEIINFEKHKISLSETALAEWSKAMFEASKRHGEQRIKATVPIRPPSYSGLCVARQYDAGYQPA